MARTRVLFDAFELVRGAGKSMGIYNYALRAFDAMADKVPDGFELCVACNAASAAEFDPAGRRGVRRVVLADGAPSKWQRQAWLRWGARRESLRQEAAVYLSPKGFLPGMFGPLRGLRTVVVVHDLIPMWYAEHHPGYFGRVEERLVVGGLERSVRWSDRLIAISQATRADLATRLQRVDGVDVVLNGLPTMPVAPVPEREPYIFAITSALPHKNARGVLEAYATYRRLVAEPLPLRVAGIDDPGQPGVSVTGRLDDAEIHATYAGARAFLFLSLAEGFGFPPLEAMSHGTPVVASDIPPLRELTDGVVDLVDPSSPAAAGAALARVVERIDPDYAERARAVAARYGWGACASGLWSSVEHAVAMPGR